MDPKQERIDGLEKALNLIVDIAIDYDGYRSAPGLMQLIDELREIASKAVVMGEYPSDGEQS